MVVNESVSRASDTREESIERFVVVAYGWDGTCVERAGGFDSRLVARITGDRLFVRTDVASVTVEVEVPRPVKRTYR